MIKRLYVKKLLTAVAEKKAKKLTHGLGDQSELEQFLNDLAHDLKQPLSVIAMYAQGCIRRVEADNYQKADLIRIMKNTLQQVDKVTEIIGAAKKQKSSAREKN